jgi:hypothetical protein
MRRKGRPVSSRFIPSSRKEEVTEEKRERRKTKGRVNMQSKSGYLTSPREIETSVH